MNTIWRARKNIKLIMIYNKIYTNYDNTIMPWYRLITFNIESGLNIKKGKKPAYIKKPAEYV